MDRLKIALYLACRTGLTDPDRGNLVDVTIDHGADTSIGTTVITWTSANNYYLDKFMTYSAQGRNVNDSNYLAEYYTRQNTQSDYSTIAKGNINTTYLSPASYGL